MYIHVQFKTIPPKIMYFNRLISSAIWKSFWNCTNFGFFFQSLQVFSDGTLFFENVGVHHIGNWSCYDQYRSGFQQVHTLQVNSELCFTHCKSKASYGSHIASQQWVMFYTLQVNSELCFHILQVNNVLYFLHIANQQWVMFEILQSQH